jgi:hypothetical protein
MTASRIATLVYGASAVVSAAAFWAIGRPDMAAGWQFTHGLGPFLVLAVTLAGARGNVPVPGYLELVLAGLWFLCLFSRAVWWWVWRVGSGTTLVDGVAVVIGLVALAFGVASVALLLQRGKPRSPWILHALAFGVLTLYFAREGATVYLSTRTITSGGLAAISFEVSLALYVPLLCSALLAAGALLARWREALH